RFAPETGDFPMRYGRRYVPRRGRNPPTVWERRVVRDVTKIIGRSQKTWGALERSTLQFFENFTEAQNQAPLGRAARLLDIVPWKFAEWGRVNNALKEQLLELGAPWLRQALEANCPKAIIACGQDVRCKMHELDAEAPAYIPDSAQCGWFNIDTPQGRRRVPWFGVCHPSSWPVENPAYGEGGPLIDAFKRDIKAIVPYVREALSDGTRLRAR
ncbi:MAG: hypothetical protein JWP44_4967, partial [Mucilaginibacter sp.]|nr:hypothetical protein [Mucilaginibacter sp.]